MVVTVTTAILVTVTETETMTGVVVESGNLKVKKKKSVQPKPKPKPWLRLLSKNHLGQEEEVVQTLTQTGTMVLVQHPSLKAFLRSRSNQNQN